jgi:uncharacterized membrane protein YqaE (UPF0057 family)
MKKSFFFSFIILMVFTSNAAIPSASKNNDSTVNYTSKTDEKMVKDAMQAFASLSKAEKKARFGEVKSLVKNYHQQQNEDGTEVSTNTLLYAILAILLPPLAVGLHEGGINNRFWISLLLSLLFFLPGIIYALIVVLT